jgi:hypothetical protein
MLPYDTLGNLIEKNNIDVLRFTSFLYAAESNNGEEHICREAEDS